MKEKCALKNEDGFVLVLTLIILALLTLLGISASTTSSIEIQISGNDKVYKENFYMAEAGSMEAAQQIDNGGAEMRDPTSPNRPNWLNYKSNEEDLPHPNDATSWNDTYSERLPASIDPDQQTRSLVLFKGIPSGVSLDMSKTHEYEYECYGRCTRNKGVVVIRIGYRKAFL